MYTAISAVAGTLTIGYLSSDFLEKFIPIFIAIIAIYTLLSKTVVTEHQGLPMVTRYLKVKQSTQGLFLDFYDGLAGPGTGAFWTASSGALYKINILLSCGLARSTNFVSNFCSLLTFIYFGHVNFLIGISMGIFMMLGAAVGVHWTIKFSNRFIRPVFIIVVISMSVNLTYHAWSTQ